MLSKDTALLVAAGGLGGAALIAAGGSCWIWTRYGLPAGRRLAWQHQQLIGHRGCRVGKPLGSGPPPENTLEAFKYALDKGAHGIELDTRLTKDGVAVVFHDAHVDRCLSCSRSQVEISSLTFEEVQQLSFKNAEGVRVPTLEDAVAFVKKHGMKVLIETKDIHLPEKLAAIVVDLIRKYDMLDDALVISFDPFSLYHVRKLDPDILTCFLWCPGLVSYYRTTSLEILPKWWRRFSPLLDLILAIGAHPALIPSLLGVSAIGPETTFRRRYLKAASRRGMSTYLWVVDDTKLRADVTTLEEDGLIAYSTDDLW